MADLSMAVSVRMVVMPMPTLPGTDVCGMKSASQPRRTKMEEGR